MLKQFEPTLARAEYLALQAREAALAGDHKRAAALRVEMDSIYAQLEAHALAGKGQAKQGQLQPLEPGR